MISQTTNEISANAEGDTKSSKLRERDEVSSSKDGPLNSYSYVEFRCIITVKAL